MDTEEDHNRAETTARAVRTFADLDRDTDLDGEEFTGYDDVSDGSDSDESEADGAELLKVSAQLVDSNP
jgi:hypothetical protein